MASASSYYLPDSSIEIRDFLHNSPENEEAINQIVRWSTRESMVAIGALSIHTHSFAKAAYTSNDNELVGYAAITHIYSPDVMELGGLMVSSAVRGRGVGSLLTKAVVEHAKEIMDPHQIIAFSNTDSAPIFKKLGGDQIEDAASLPDEVWKICHTCRFYEEALEENKACCGRVYDITNIVD